MNKMKKLWPAWLVLGLSLVLIPAMAFANPRGGGQRGGHMKEITESLTEEQKDAIQELRIEHQKEMIDHRAEMEDVMEELHDLYLEDASESQIMNKVEEIGRLRTEADKKRAKLIIEIRDLLTDEQKEILEEAGGLMGFMGGGHGGRGGGRPGGHRGGGGHGGPGGGPGEHRPGAPGGPQPVE